MMEQGRWWEGGGEKEDNDDDDDDDDQDDGNMTEVDERRWKKDGRGRGKRAGGGVEDVKEEWK